MSKLVFLESEKADDVCFLDDGARVLLVTHDGAENHEIDVEDDIVVCDGKIFYHKTGTPAGVFFSDRSFDWYESYLTAANEFGVDALYDGGIMLSGRPIPSWGYHVCVMPETDSLDVIFCSAHDDNPEPVRYSTAECEDALRCRPVNVGVVTRVNTIPADSENPVKKLLHAALVAICPSPLMRGGHDGDGDDC